MRRARWENIDVTIMSELERYRCSKAAIHREGGEEAIKRRIVRGTIEQQGRSCRCLRKEREIMEEAMRMRHDLGRTARRVSMEIGCLAEARQRSATAMGGIGMTTQRE